MAPVKLGRLLVIYLIWITGSEAAEKKVLLTSVADMRYGVALFHYYQGAYMDALTELLVAEKRGGS